MKPLYPQSPKRSADDVVDAFFSRLALCLDTVDAIAMDRAEILAYFAQPVLRQAHRQHALADIARYQAVAADVLYTARAVSLKSSVVSQALLVDWLTMAPDFVLERLSA